MRKWIPAVLVLTLFVAVLAVPGMAAASTTRTTRTSPILSLAVPGASFSNDSASWVYRQTWQDSFYYAGHSWKSSPVKLASIKVQGVLLPAIQTDVFNTTVYRSGVKKGILTSMSFADIRAAGSGKKSVAFGYRSVTYWRNYYVNGTRVARVKTSNKKVLATISFF